MDTRISKLTTVDQCRAFEENAARLNQSELAKQARIRLLEIRAGQHGDLSPAERDCLQAVIAYEETLFRKNGRRTAASRTWQMIKRVGILAAAERAVSRPIETAGFRNLVEMGLQEYAFEAVILRHRDSFGPEAVRVSKERLEHLQTQISESQHDRNLT